MKNVQRKTKLRVEEAAKRLREVMERDADPEGFPKTDPKFVPQNRARLEESTAKLFMWLDHFEKKRDSFSYSMLLQLWLGVYNFRWPMKDVFKLDLDSKGPGRPVSRLAKVALQMYNPNKFGYRKVAQKMFPQDYLADPDKAVKHVKDLVKTGSNERKQGDDSPDIYDALRLLF